MTNWIFRELHPVKNERLANNDSYLFTDEMENIDRNPDRYSGIMKMATGESTQWLDEFQVC
jgi:hypothetical protein